jgi:Spx/MgsR family transcriptional regulator
MAKTKVRFLQKPTCSTCRKAKEFLETLGADFELRSLDADPLSEAELDTLIGTRDYKQFLNPRNELYREKNMKEMPPTRAQAIKLMAKHPNLIRRPVVVRDDQIVLGFDEAAFKKLMAEPPRARAKSAT